MSILAPTASARLLGRSPGVPYAPAMEAAREDSALMLRYRDGDIAAFECLYGRYKDPLFRYLQRLCGNRQAAEDIFQEVWGKIIKSRGKYQATARFSTFLYRVAHNCFIDHVRRNKRHLHTTSLDVEDQPGHSAEPDVEVDQQLARQQMLSALDELPVEQRDVFLLYAEAGLSVDLIAGVTGVSFETAKSRLRYAVVKLKKRLAVPDSALDDAS